MLPRGCKFRISAIPSREKIWWLALDPLLKPQALQKLQHSRKRNVRVGVPSQNLFKKFVSARHNCQRWRKPNAANNRLQAEDAVRLIEPRTIDLAGVHSVSPALD